MALPARKSDVPADARRTPAALLAYATTLEAGLAHLRTTEAVLGRLALYRAVRGYASLFGRAADPVRRETLAGQLGCMRHLGGLLDGVVKRPRPGGRATIQVIRDDLLPDGVSKNLSSQAQTFARVPAEWVTGTKEAIRQASRRATLKEIYLEARRLLAGQEAPTLPSGLLVGDFREIGAQVPDASVALCFTDPPYDRASLPLYGDLARFAARVLAPGGSLMAYAPTYALPEVFAAMADSGLRYWWTLAVRHTGGHALMREYGIRVGYKPLVWYAKGGRLNKQQVIADVIEGTPEKTEHEWQQSVAEAKRVIELLTATGDLVCDPMAGSGTTLLAAAEAGRRWIGIEEKPETAALFAQRLE